MFRHLGDFGHQRTPVQAIGFYLVYLFTGLILSGLVGALFAFATGANGFDEGMAAGLKIGPVFAILLSGALAFMILRAKGLFRDAITLIAAALSLVGAAGLGLLLGLLFVAFLTTRPSSREIDAVAHPVERAAS
jgi:hypothetical protein